MTFLSHVLNQNAPFFELIQLLSPNHFRPESITDKNWTQIIVYADRMQVAPLLFFMLKQYPDIRVPEEKYHILRSAYLANSARNLTLTHETSRILRSFEDLTIPVIPLKGAYLADAVYEHPSNRKMLDLDLMVKWEDMAKAIASLETLGYNIAERCHLDGTYKRLKHHGPRLIHPSGIIVELHWNITDVYIAGKKGSNLGKNLWLRASQGLFLGYKVYILTPEDLIFHSIIHQTVHHGFKTGIREFFDIAGIYRKYQHDIDWKYLIELADEMNLKRPLFLTLTLTDMITGTDITTKLNLKGYFMEIPGNYLTAAISEITREGQTQIRTFHIIRTNPNLLELIRSTIEEVFLSRKTMEIYYQVPGDSPKIFLFYPYRLLDLIAHYGPDLIREYFSLSQKNRNKQFWKWMNGG